MRRLIVCAVVMFTALCARVPAQGVDFSASVDRSKVQVGSVIQFSLKINSASQVGANPTMPDFGGLQVVGGPFTQQGMTMINGAISVQNSMSWQLRAPREGTFTIGPARLEVNGQVYQSKPITVTVTMQPPANLPDDLKNEPILPARSNNDEINKQLNGRLFLRVQVSDKNPYVSEPVLVTYSLYWDRVSLQGLQYQDAPVHTSSGLVEDRFRATGDIQYTNETHGDRTYQVAKIYQMMLTPTQPGDCTIDSFVVVARLPIRRQSGADDPFSAFDDSMFGNPFRSNAVQVEIPSAPIKLNVKALPTNGQPAGFSGTVGNFTLKASADRASMRQDELLTLDVRLEGRGAVDLASAPKFPDNDAFELVDQTQEIDKNKPKDTIGGTKHFQYSLRPKKSGQISVPALAYPVFDSGSESYRVLNTAPVPVTVTPVAGASAIAAASGEKITRNGAPAAQLNYLEPVGEIRRGRVEPLMESPLMWIVLIAGTALLLGSWHRDWRRARLDPAAVRRGGAWRNFEKRIRAIKSNGQTPEAVGSFEHAVRNLIADYYNTSAEGLTREQIAELLGQSNLTREQVTKLLERLDACQWANYAPSAQKIDIQAWSNETRAMLKEGLR